MEAITFSTMSKACKKCSLSVECGQLFTVCEGDCAGLFHAECVGLIESDILVLSAHSMNIIWMCVECMQRFRKARDGMANTEGKQHNTTDVTANNESNEKSMHDEVNDLKVAVAGIIDTLSKLVPSDSTVDHPVLHSTPVSSFVLQSGTNSYASIVNNDERSPQQSVSDESNFSLLLTNIDVSVTECDIHRMVADALGIGIECPENIDVTKLVSQWKTRKADYISFKVDLNSRWKPKALNPATWPKCIKYREFMKRCDGTWKPV